MGRMAKKIISRIISSDMGKSFNEAIKQEVGETESAIEKIREDLRKKSCQESRSKKKNKRDKSKDGRDKKKKKRDRHEDEENPSNLPEGRKSLDLIKEELERVTSKVNNIKKNSSSKEISSDDDMKVIMKDVEDMEQDLNEITAEPEDGRRSRSKKKK